MTETKEQTFLFDPGYAQHTTILSINIDYTYAGINQFKNFGQRKMQFKMLYPKILRIVDNNTGFCLGSLLWAAYLKTKKGAQIEGNPCLDGTYDKDETVEEADYSINYYSQLQKDSKYYLGINYEINPLHIKILELYKEFLVLNHGFVSTRTSDDIVLPACLSVPSDADAQVIYNKIQDVIKSGNLLDLTEVFGLIYKEA